MAVTPVVWGTSIVQVFSCGALLSRSDVKALPSPEVRVRQCLNGGCMPDAAGVSWDARIGIRVYLGTGQCYAVVVNSPSPVVTC